MINKLKDVLISDLDGCLITKSNLNELYLNLLILSNKYNVIIATGRDKSKMGMILNDSNIMNKIIGVVMSNGTTIKYNNETIYFSFSNDEKMKILKLFEDIDIISQCDVGICIKEKKKFFNKHSDFVKYIQEIGSFEKIMIAIPKESLALLNWIIMYLFNFNFNFYLDLTNNEKFYYIEIKAEKVNKYISAEYLINKSNLKYTNILSYGNDFNDVPLLYCNNNYVNAYFKDIQNKYSYLNNLIKADDLYKAFQITVKNISSPFTSNKVFLISDSIIKKKFKSKSKYLVEKNVYTVLSPNVIPKLLLFDDDTNSLYIDKCEEIESINDENLISLVEDFHNTTISPNHSVKECSSNESFSDWYAYMKVQVDKWKLIISPFLFKSEELLSNLLSKLKNRDKVICLLHRDIRAANIGMIDNRYVLYDFELAMWGDPLWDYARICYERGDRFKKALIFRVNILENEIECFTLLYVFSFFNYLLQHEKNNTQEINKCLAYIERNTEKWI